MVIIVQNRSLSCIAIILCTFVTDNKSDTIAFPGDIAIDKWKFAPIYGYAGTNLMIPLYIPAIYHIIIYRNTELF